MTTTTRATAPKRKKARRKVVAESRSEDEGVYQLQYVACGKPDCGRCRTRPAHGPYWYFYQWIPAKPGAKRGSKGKLRCTYVGKKFERRIA